MASDTRSEVRESSNKGSLGTISFEVVFGIVGQGGEICNILVNLGALNLNLFNLEQALLASWVSTYLAQNCSKN